MKKTLSAGNKAGLVVLVFLLAAGLCWQDAEARSRQAVDNPLLNHGGLGKAGVPIDATEVTCRVGMVENRICNTTFEKVTGTEDWTIIIGDDALELPSMVWKTPSRYSMNSYLYYASLRLGYQNKLVHLSSDRATPIDTTSNVFDTTAISAFDTHFYIDDQSPRVPDELKIGVRVHEYTYAWSESYRDDFIIYDFWIVNINQRDTLNEFYVALHADCDVATAEGGDGAQAYSRDDLADYYRDDVNKEYISYIYDGDNPTVPGNDIGGNKIPKECAGYIGSRLLYCPPVMGTTDTTRQTGHGWWDWNSDPSDDEEYYARVSDTSWLAPPPSPHDFRYLQKMGPFSIPAGDSIRVVLAFGIGEGLEGLRTNLAWAAKLFEDNWIGPSAPPSPSFTVTCEGNNQVTIEWSDTPENTPDPSTGEYDFEGYRVWRKTQTGPWTLIMECDKIDSIGPNTGLVHSFVDHGVNDYYPYWYSVTSYDKGYPLQGIEPLESGKGVGKRIEVGVNFKTANPETGIHVIPNPFVARIDPDFGYLANVDFPSTDRIVFVNLPDNATIRVYTLTGDLLTTLKTSRDANGDWEKRANWDLITDKMQTVVSGLYLYVVSAPGEDDFIGKFAVVR